MAKIINEWPPNIEEIRKHFRVKGTVFFTYGDAIYNPDGVVIPRDYIRHEEVHMAQQKQAGGPELWWDRYFAEPAFRASQEIEAYGIQLRYIRKNNGKTQQALEHFATALSSPLYGNCITTEDAAKAIFERSLKPWSIAVV